LVLSATSDSSGGLPGDNTKDGTPRRREGRAREYPLRPANAASNQGLASTSDGTCHSWLFSAANLPRAVTLREKPCLAILGERARDRLSAGGRRPPRRLFLKGRRPTRRRFPGPLRESPERSRAMRGAEGRGPQTDCRPLRAAGGHNS